MKYRDMLGFPKKKSKKKVIPEQPKPSVSDKLKEEFGLLNEWSKVDTGPKRWTGSGLTEFERKGGKDNVNEGPAYEYAANLKAIEKSYKTFKTEVFKFANLLEKKGLKKEAGIFEKSFSKKAGDWYRFFERQVRKLM